MTLPRIALCVQRIGPYHHARFAAAADRFDLQVVEFRADDKVYAWDKVVAEAAYGRSVTRTGGVSATLNRIAPEIVVTVGYADPEVQQAAKWALSREVPLVVCSDSTELDEPRRGWKEWLKSQIVGAYDAGLCAGSRSINYLASLGLPAERLFQAWDVVDNDHFARGAAVARSDPGMYRGRLGLPERYFLCVARFVPKKNLGRLIEAYAEQQSILRGDQRRALVLSGSGPLEAELRLQAKRCGVGESVVFAGFRQYDDLPAIFGLADALVLPSASDQWGLVVNEAMASGLPVLVSEAAGCAPDLVQPGQNGLRFDPLDVGSIAAALAHVNALSQAERAAWGRRSAEIISRFSLQSFAEGLAQAVAAAAVRRSKPMLAGMALRLAAGRRVSP